MKFLVLVSCAVASASAAYYGPQHIPVIGPNGVPIEPQEVQAARASHLAALSAAYSVATAVPYFNHYNVYGVPALGHNALHLDAPKEDSNQFNEFVVAVPLVVGPLPGPHLTDTPEVQVARAAHLAAHAKATARAHPSSYLDHHRGRRDVYKGIHIPVIGPDGVPEETPEVQAAKAYHLSALADAYSRAGTNPYTYVRAKAYEPSSYADPDLRYYGPHADIGPDGHPVETQEVKSAKAYHFAAHAALNSAAYLANSVNFI